MANIALLPGGFKPPHAGHYAVAKYLSQKSGAEVLVRVGAKERDGITQDMSIDIWKLYGINAEPASSDSPIADVFKYVEEKATEKDTIYVGTGEKDFPRFKVLTDPSFKPENYEKYNPKGIKVIEIPIPPQAGGVSGTKMREFIMNDQKDQFQEFLPDHVDKDKVWNIVIGLNEDLYNPEDKVNDYMRSSEFKAGYKKKGKITPAYKYKRGGMYTGGGMGFGGMYESRGGESELHVYDFDDTIAQVKTNIRVTITSPKGDYKKELDVSSDKFPKVSKELETKFSMMNFDYDFSEFEKDIEDAIISSEVLNKLKASLKDPSVQTTILTARTEGEPVINFFKEIGLDPYIIPLGSMVGGKRVTGQDKADWIEKRINDKKGIKKVYFIDDSAENRKAVYTLRDNNPEIEFKIETPPAIKEMMGMMNKQEKAKHAKNMKRLSKDMSNMKGNNYGGGGYKVPDYVKGTLTRKLYEEMSVADVDAVDTFADKQLNPVDVDLTSDHFFDRLNDPRNKKDISGAELIGFFKRLSKRKKEFVEFLTKYKELVVHDNRTNINIPFMKLANKAIAKTVMRKKDFQTSSPKLSVGETMGDSMYIYDEDNVDENFPPYVANQVQQTRYKASDTFTRDVKKSKKMGYKEGVFTKDWWKQQINEVMTETKANTHLTHLEELILTQGQDGFNQAKNFLYELIKNLKGEDNTIKNVSVKWDGAPAIFTGINPENGKFFVGTKSVFNKDPKINYTSQDIDRNHGHAAGLAKKLKLALAYLPALGIKNILQGDFMFDSDDVDTQNIEDKPHYTFKPNTIRYAVEANSELGKKVIAARIGIIFHTTYNDLSGGGASFGADVSGLSKSPSVWFDDAYFKDDTGILLSDEEEKFVLEKINEADSINVDYKNESLVPIPYGLSNDYSPVISRDLGQQTTMPVSTSDVDELAIEWRLVDQPSTSINATRIDNNSWEFDLPPALQPSIIEWRAVMNGDGPTQVTPWFRIAAQEPALEVDQLQVYLQAFAFCIFFLTLVLTLQSRYLNNQEDLTTEIDQTKHVSQEENLVGSTPPLPEGGLPDGWTMEQWKWYGHEYLEGNK